MIWDIYWGLALGFILSSLIRAFISTESISAGLGKNSVKALSLSTFFGAISSSCSYAAASMARALMIKGATWSNAVAFILSESHDLLFEDPNFSVLLRVATETLAAAQMTLFLTLNGGRDARERLSAFKVPTVWVRGDAGDVPMTATAKVDKAGLQELLRNKGQA